MRRIRNQTGISYLGMDLRMTRLLATLLMILASAAAGQQTADAVQPEAATSGTFESLSVEVQASLAAKQAGQPVEADNGRVTAA